MLEEQVLQEQRAEAELIAARLFRFRARRSIGVLYSLFSLLPLTGVILFATVPVPLAIAGVLGGMVAVWVVARSSGFAQLSRMQYSLDFIKGGKGSVYDARKEVWLSRRTNLAWFLASAWPWFGYVITTVEGYPFYAAVCIMIFVAEFVAITVFSQLTKVSSIFKWRIEDWAFVLGDVCIAFAALVPGAPSWTWVFATPLFVFCGTKSLYDAPKELALVGP
jgi:hypothetical protein